MLQLCFKPNADCWRKQRNKMKQREKVWILFSNVSPRYGRIMFLWDRWPHNGIIHPAWPWFNLKAECFRMVRYDTNSQRAFPPVLILSRDGPRLPWVRECAIQRYQIIKLQLCISKFTAASFCRHGDQQHSSQPSGASVKGPWRVSIQIYWFPSLASTYQLPWLHHPTRHRNPPTDGSLNKLYTMCCTTAFITITINIMYLSLRNQSL